MTEPLLSHEDGLRTRLTRPGNALTRIGVIPRRVLVGAAAAGMVAAAALPWAVGESGVPIAVVALFGSLVISTALDLTTRTIFQLSHRVLDERSRYRRDRAAYVAMRVTTVLVLLIAVLVTLAAGRPDFDVSVPQVMSSAIAVALLIAALPVWVLAWTEPGPLPDDDDDIATSGPAGGPVGSFPWLRMITLGVYFGLVMGVFGLLGWGGQPQTPTAALASGLFAGVLFAALMSLYTAWSRRRL